MRIKIPKNEILWVTYYDNEGNPSYVMTSKELRDKYFLYAVLDDGEVKKVSTGKTPVEAVTKYGSDLHLRL